MPTTTAETPPANALRLKARTRGAWSDAWERFRRNRLAMVSAVLLVGLLLACFIGPFLSPYSATAQTLANSNQPPGAAHWFGTDSHGRDLLTRVLVGGRVSFMVGFVATLVAATIGVAYGCIAGLRGGKTDAVMMRVVDILYSFPFTIFVILLMVMFGKQFWLMFVAIGAVEWLTMSRIVRGQVLSLKEQQFVEAARALGQSGTRVLVRHILPNLLGPVIVYATLTVPAVMLLEAFISFLGLGVQPPMTSWGDLIRVGAQDMEDYPWLLIFPGLCFSLTLFALNFLGDGLRDAFDPREAHR